MFLITCPCMNMSIFRHNKSLWVCVASLMHQPWGNHRGALEGLGCSFLAEGAACAVLYANANPQKKSTSCTFLVDALFFLYWITRDTKSTFSFSLRRYFDTWNWILGLFWNSVALGMFMGLSSIRTSILGFSPGGCNLIVVSIQSPPLEVSALWCFK